jgi:hypothetical protein
MELPWSGKLAYAVHWHWTQRPGFLSRMRNSVDKLASDFAVDPRVCIEARDRAGREWLLRLYARPPFALERLRLRGGVSSCPTTAPNRRAVASRPNCVSPLELIERVAALVLVPVPRTHRHRYYGVLAPNSPLRTLVTPKPQRILVHELSASGHWWSTPCAAYWEPGPGHGHEWCRPQ